MRYDNDAYLEVFPVKKPEPEIKVETPIETFMPSVTEETLVNRTEQANEEPSVNQTNEPEINE